MPASRLLRRKTDMRLCCLVTWLSLNLLVQHFTRDYSWANLARNEMPRFFFFSLTVYQGMNLIDYMLTFKTLCLQAHSQLCLQRFLLLSSLDILEFCGTTWLAACHLLPLQVSSILLSLLCQTSYHLFTHFPASNLVWVSPFAVGPSPVSFVLVGVCFPNPYTWERTHLPRSTRNSMFYSCLELF